MRLPLRAFVLALLVVAQVGAQPSAADQALATELFKQGRALMAQENYAEARDKLARSHLLDPGGGTALNLGICYERNGQYASAWKTFREALEMARRDGRTDREALALERLAVVEHRMSRMTIAVPAEAVIPGLRIALDESAVDAATWGVPVPVDAGTHRISASAPGHESWTQSIEVEDGPNAISVPVLKALPAVEEIPARTDVVVPPRARAHPASPPSDRAPSVADPGASHRLAGWLTGSLGVGSVGVGTFFAIRAMRKQSESDRECSGGCSENGAQLSREAGSAADIATVGFVLGGVALGTGTYLVLTAPTPQRANTTSARAGFLWHGEF